MKKTYSIYFLFLLFLSCDFKTPTEYAMEAELYADNKNYTESNKLLDKALQKDSTFIGAYVNKGANYSDLGRYEDVIKIYKGGLKYDPNNTMLLYNIGNNYRRIDSNKISIKYYDLAFDTKGSDLICIDYIKRNDYFNLAKEYDISCEEIHYSRGIAYLNIDSLKQSMNDFNYSLNRNYEMASCLYYIGIIYLENYQDELGCLNLYKSANFGDEDAVWALKEYCN